jgi:hypothetical protein
MQYPLPEVTGNGHMRRRPGLMKPFMLILFASLTSVMMLNCKQRDPVEQAALYGKWDIAKAERNGKETPYLRGGYFIINPDGTITINITGEDERGKFILDRDVIRMNEEKEFEIRSLTADSLTVMYTAAEHSDFIFYMNRHEGEAQ